MNNKMNNLIKETKLPKNANIKLRNAITEIKNSIGSLSSKLGAAKEGICQMENRPVENIQAEAQS